MKAKTRMFGEIDIQEDKIITLESGMIGFPDMQKFTLIFDEEKGSKSHIMCLPVSYRPTASTIPR